MSDATLSNLSNAPFVNEKLWMVRGKEQRIIRQRYQKIGSSIQ